MRVVVNALFPSLFSSIFQFRCKFLPDTLLFLTPTKNVCFASINLLWMLCEYCDCECIYNSTKKWNGMYSPCYLRDLPELCQHGVYVFKGLVDLLPNLSDRRHMMTLVKSDKRSSPYKSYKRGDNPWCRPTELPKKKGLAANASVTANNTGIPSHDTLS